jgi:hypothetical protein
VHYDTFPQFKAGLNASPDAPRFSDAKIDILFQHYLNARGQPHLTLGRLPDTTGERKMLGSVFEGKGELLLTPQAVGFDKKAAPKSAPSSKKNVVPAGIANKEWMEKDRPMTAKDWSSKSVEEQVNTMLGNRWSIWLNDSFILGGIHGHVAFELISKVDPEPDPTNPYGYNVTQREIIGLVMFGYSPDRSTKKPTYKCTNTGLADGATFQVYADHMKRLTVEFKSAKK